MVEKILNNTTPYGKIRASHEGWLHSSTLRYLLQKHVLVRTQCLVKVFRQNELFTPYNLTINIKYICILQYIVLVMHSSQLILINGVFAKIFL